MNVDNRIPEAVVGYFLGDDTFVRLMRFCGANTLPLLAAVMPPRKTRSGKLPSPINPRGEHVLEVILINRLEIHNVGNVPKSMTSARPVATTVRD